MVSRENRKIDLQSSPVNQTKIVADSSTYPSLAQQDVSLALPIEFGRYRLLKQLGAGGMGAVFLAHDRELNRQVALKLPHAGNTTGTQIERFRREARLSSTLDHPNICRVYDIGEHNGRLFLTMEYIAGNSLHEIIRAKGAVVPRIAANLVRGVANAVHFAHSQGIIHRDLKPANIMVKKNQQFVIMDFGLARRFEHEDEQITATGAVLGTPAYMAPEQLRGESDLIGPQADVYSLGIILYELLVGERPFQGTLPQIYSQVLTTDSVVPAFEYGIDLALCVICRKATASDVSQRYATAADLATALGDYSSRTVGSVPSSDASLNSVMQSERLAGLVTSSENETPSTARSNRMVDAKPITSTVSKRSTPIPAFSCAIRQDSVRRRSNAYRALFLLPGVILTMAVIVFSSFVIHLDFRLLTTVVSSAVGPLGTGNAHEQGDALGASTIAQNSSRHDASSGTLASIESTQQRASVDQALQRAAQVQAAIRASTSPQTQAPQSESVERQPPVERSLSIPSQAKSNGGTPIEPSLSTSLANDLWKQSDATRDRGSDHASQNVVQAISQLLDSEQDLCSSFAAVQEQVGYKQSELVQFSAELQLCKTNVDTCNRQITLLEYSIAALQVDILNPNLTNAQRVASTRSLRSAQARSGNLKNQVQGLLDRASLIDRNIQKIQLELVSLGNAQAEHYQKLQEMLENLDNGFLSAFSFFRRASARELLSRSSDEEPSGALFARLVRGYAHLHLDEFQEAKEEFLVLLQSTQATGPELMFRLTQVGYARCGLELKSLQSLQAVPGIADLSERKGSGGGPPISQAITYEWLLCQAEYLVLRDKPENSLGFYELASKKLPNRCDAYRMQSETLIAICLTKSRPDRIRDALRLAEQAVQLSGGNDYRNNVTLAKAQLIAGDTKSYMATRAIAIDMAEDESRAKITAELDSHMRQLSGPRR